MKTRAIGALSKGVTPYTSTSTYLRPAAVARLNPLLSRRQLSSSSSSRLRTTAHASIPAQSARNLPRIGARNSSSTSGSAPLKKTQLYDLHVAWKGKLVEYAGFSMPLQYEDLSHSESHKWTREKASLFDVSHM